MDDSNNTIKNAMGEYVPVNMPTEPKKHSGFYKVWRVVYPALIFILIQLGIGMGIGMVYSVSLVMQSMPNIPDPMTLTLKISEFLLDNTLLIMLVSGAISLPIFAFMFRRQMKGQKSTALTLLKPFDYVLIFALSVFANFAVSGLMESFDIVKYFPDYAQLEKTLMNGSLLLQVLSVGIIAPIVEEFLLRGVVFNRLRGYVKLVPALLIQALIFGILHMNVLQGLYAFVIALLFGFIYIKYGTLIVCILSHIVFNMTSIIFAVIAEGIETEFSPFVIFIPALLLTFAMLWVIVKRPAVVNTATEANGEIQG